MARSLAAAVLVCLALAPESRAQSEEPVGPPPPVKDRDDGDGRPNFRAWPFFYSVYTLDRRETTLLYLYHSVEGDGHTELRLRPFFGYERDDAEDRTEVDVLWPLLSHERKGEESWTAVRPFYWRHDDPAKQEGYSTLLPLWWAQWTPESKTVVTLPGWFYNREKDRTDLHMWPLFGRHDLEEGGTRWFTAGHTFWLDTGRKDGFSFSAPFPLIHGSWSEEEAFALIAPLLAAHRRIGQDSWTVAAPWLFHSSSPGHHKVWSIPYAYTETPEDVRHDVLFPFFTREYAKDGSSSSTSLRPLYWYDRNPDRTWEFLAPLFLGYQDKESKRFFSIPYAYNETAESIRHDVLFPFITRKSAKDGSSSSTSVRPFYFYDRNEERTWETLLPLYYHRKDAKGENERFLSLPYAYNEDAASVRHDVLFPFFTHKYAKDGSASATSVRPFYFYDRNEERTWETLLPLYYRSKDASGENERFLSLPYAYTEDPESVRHDVLFPFFTREYAKDDSSSSTSVRPFYFYDRNEERTWEALLPLYYNRKDADSQTFLSIPYAYSEDAESVRHDVLFPFFTREYAKDDSSSSTSVRPFYFYDRNEERMWQTLLPLFYHRKDSETERFLSLPYAYSETVESIRHDILFPLFTRESAKDGSSSSTSFRPFYFYDRNEERTWEALLPLYYNRKDADSQTFLSIPYAYSEDAESVRHDVLFPFFTREYAKDDSSSSTSVRPFYFYDRNEERMWQTLLPLFYHRKDSETERFLSLPYAYTETVESIRHDILFPLFTRESAKDGSSSSTSFRPFYFYDRNEERTWEALLPLYYNRKDADSQTFLSIPYVYSEDAESVRHDVLFPFFTREYAKDDSSSSTSVRPFYFYDRNEERMWQTLLPLFYHRKDSETERFLSLPYAYTETVESIRHDILFPLFTRESAKDGSSSSTSFRPFYFYDRNEERTWEALLPLYYNRKDADSQTFLSIPYAYSEDAESVRHDVLFPFFTREYAKDDSSSSTSVRPFYFYDRNEERMWQTLLPLFYHRKDSENERFLSLPYAYTETVESIRHDILFPLFTRESAKDGSSSSTSFRPFYFYDRNEERTWEALLPLYYNRKDADSQTFLSIPYAYSEDAESVRHDVLFPFFTREYAKDDSSSSTSVRPFYFYDRNEERMWQTLLPLFYHRKDSENERFLSLPYAYTETVESIRHDILFPLFTRESAKDGSSSSTSFRPFYFYDRNEERTWEALLPLYYNRKDADSQTFLSIPYAYSEDAESVRHDVLFPFFTREYAKDDSSSSTSVRPFYFYDRNEERTWELLFPLFYGYSDEERTRFWSLPYSYSDDAESTRHDVLFPLFTAESGKGESDLLKIALRPLYWYDHEGDETTEVALPLFYSHQTPEESTLATALFYSNRTEDESTLLTPLFYRSASETSSTLITPVWLSSSHTDEDGGEHVFAAIPPLYWYDKEPGRTWELTLPLFFNYESAGLNAFVTPLALSVEDKHEGTEINAILPLLYGSRRTKDGICRTVLPLYWDLDPDGPDRTIHLWPFFSYSRVGEYTEYSTLWPLFSAGSGPEQTRIDLLWPLGRHESTATGTHSRFLPFYWYDSDEEGFSLDIGRPLVHAEGDDERFELSFLKYFATYSSEGDDYDMRVLGWVYRNRREGRTRDHYLMPFFKYRAEEDRSSLWVLYPLVDYESGPEGTDLDVLWRGFTYHADDDGSEARLLHKLFHYRDTTKGGLLEINPFFSSEWEPNGDRLISILGGLYYRQKRKGEWRSGGLFGVF